MPPNLGGVSVHFDLFSIVSPDIASLNTYKGLPSQKQQPCERL